MECKAREIKKGISRETTLKQDLKHEKERWLCEEV